MILQRFFDFVLSALGWLVDLFFPRLVLMTILLCLGGGAFFLLLACNVAVPNVNLRNLVRRSTLERTCLEPRTLRD